jgi:hypothetical protein
MKFKIRDYPCEPGKEYLIMQKDSQDAVNVIQSANYLKEQSVAEQRALLCAQLGINTWNKSQEQVDQLIADKTNQQDAMQ